MSDTARRCWVIVAALGYLLNFQQGNDVAMCLSAGALFSFAMARRS